MNTLIARPYLELHEVVPGAPMPIVEGPAFDRSGVLYFTSVHGDAEGNRVFKADLRSRTVTPVYADEDSSFAGIAIHADGSLYLADLGLARAAGRIVRMRPDGTGAETLVSSCQGEPFYPDDLVFDRRGALFFNDMQGNVMRPTGKILQRTPDGTVNLVSDGIASPNGIAFDPSWRHLWVSEHNGNRLLVLDLDEDGRIDDGYFPGGGITVFAHLSGGEVDSLTTDAAGNVYAAMYKAGRVDVHDPVGAPVATLVPDDGERSYPNTTHVVIRPGTCEGYLVAAGPERTMLFEFTALAPGLQLYSHSTGRPSPPSGGCTGSAPIVSSSHM
ncbi:SMP-30/gluconolactonase/LRE family protein [Amycolatopsis acidicola]|uniref:SMP-30/gluconolactonase/LRE family protein n=1 Tax=Amycolatopsis acidicola TaxID=2596893 RepID=A0A5N0VCJ1_9PSEU|nr:SMP-30/gluconolactonase/LRE family protein [Amycolatopsis acidicola]KAA9163288.1 SMP-30/gluconolactonase/LRE family protein [Amycolatopsis acidicola]